MVRVGTGEDSDWKGQRISAERQWLLLLLPELSVVSDHFALVWLLQRRTGVSSPKAARGEARAGQAPGAMKGILGPAIGKSGNMLQLNFIVY